MDHNAASSPHCDHCGADIKEILIRINKSVVLSKDIDKKENIVKQLGRCCADHSAMEARIWKMVRQLKGCTLAHMIEPPPNVVNIYADASLGFYFVSNELEQEADFAKRQVKMKILKRWLICLRDHGDSEEFCLSPSRFEIKYRLEKRALAYNPEVHEDSNDLLDELTLCLRDHRPRCICRSPIDIGRYHTFLNTNSASETIGLTIKRSLFGKSKTTGEENSVVELCTKFSTIAVPERSIVEDAMSSSQSLSESVSNNFLLCSDVLNECS